MLRVPFLTLVLLVVSISGFAADTVQITTLNGLRYEAALASSAVAPKVLFSIPTGTGKDQVGSDKEDAKHATEGAPYAFLPQKDLSVIVLDTVNQKIKRFSPDGKVMSEIPLLEHQDKWSLARDLAPAPQDGFYVLCATDGKVERLDANGKSVVEIEGVNDAWEFGADPKGNLLIKNPGTNTLMRFNPAGEIIEQFEGQADLSIFTDLDGNPYGIRFTENTASLFKVLQASPTQELALASFSLTFPPEKKIHYMNARVLGVDGATNLYLEFVAGNDDGVIFQNQIVRVAPKGETLAKLETVSFPFMAPDIPRHRAVTPDGKVMGFSVAYGKYLLHTYSLP